MKITEQNITGKISQEKCEDGIIVTDDFVALIDGSTSKAKKQRSLFHSNGKEAMLMLKKYIKKADKKISVEQFCQGATAMFRKKYSNKEMALLEAHPEERLCASCIVFNRIRRQIWMVGDCQCLVNGTYYDNPKPSEAKEAAFRADYIHKKIAEGARPSDFQKVDTGRQAMMPMLLESMKGENKDYAVVDGFPIPMDKVKVLTLDFQPFDIVFASDGYPFLKPTLAESEAALAKQLADDPLCISTFLASKGMMEGQVSFDDRSYISFQV